MTKFILWITAVFTTFAACGTAHAVMPYARPIGPSTYLAANKNWAAAEDDHGFTYFGNDRGLLEFDGLDWKLYPLPRASVVRSVAALSHATIFTGSFEEFGRWDRDASGELRYTSLVPAEGEPRPRNEDFWKIHIRPEGVWFQAFSALYFYDYHTVRRIETDMNMLFLLQAGGRMWTQQMGGSLYSFVGERFERIEGSEIFRNTTVRVMLELPGEENYLIGTGTEGIWKYDGKHFTPWNADLTAVLRRYELNCGIRTARGTYLLGTILGGIYEVDATGRILDHLSTDNLLLNNTIMSLYEDESSNVWVLSDRGLIYLTYQEGIDYYTSPEWPYGSVYDAVLWKGKLFLGTNQGVFYAPADRLGTSDFIASLQRLTGIQGQVWSFSVLDGRLWCCHNSGVTEIGSNLAVRPVAAMGGYRLNRTQLFGRETTLYASYYRLRTLDLASGTSEEAGDLPESFYAVEVDHMQNVWLEHPVKGVYKCRLNRDLRSMDDVKFYGGDAGDGLPYKLQVFRVGGRVVLMGNDRFYTYNDIQDRIEPDSMLDACFAGVHGLRRIVPAGGNRFWVVASAGVYTLFYDGYTASLSPIADIPADNMVYGYERVSMLDETTSLFCCDNGFILHRNGAASAQASRPASPTIETVGAGKDASARRYFAAETSARIPFQKNSVFFRFAAKRAFSAQLSFRYRLQGMERTWTEGNTTGRALYARLPKGRYTFEVATVDRFGNISEPTRMEFEILPPWYASGWAYAAYTLLAMLLLYATWRVVMYRYRRNYLRKLRYQEILSLREANKALGKELEIRDAEIFSQSSMLIAKNEVIHKIRDMIGDFHQKQGGKTFAPLYYKINSYIHTNLDTDNDWKLFLIKFEQKHAGFFRTLKERYPDLTSNDLRLAACLRLHLDSKEIASLMNLTVRAVENSRYRLRKKLGLQPAQHLNDFLMDIEPNEQRDESDETESMVG